MDYNNVYAFADAAKHMSKIDLWEQYQRIKKWDMWIPNKMDFMYACAVALDCKYKAIPCIFKSTDRIYIVRCYESYYIDVKTEKVSLAELIRFYISTHKIKETKELEKATIVYDLDIDGSIPASFNEIFLN